MKKELLVSKIQDRAKNLGSGQPYSLSTTAAAPGLPERASVLSQQLQDIARSYVRARQRHGETLLEAARWLSEARQAAKQGEWKIFLDATGTSEDTAERLLNIHAQAMRNPQFADSVRTQQIGQSAAALLAAPSTPPQIIDQVLNAPEPMKVNEIRSAIKQAKQPARDLGPGQPTPEPWPDAPEGWRWQRRGIPCQLVGPDGWETKCYNYPERALAEANRRILSQPKSAREATTDRRPPTTDEAPFWQSMSEHHPTAHLWTRVGMNEHHAACGMVTQRAPSGSTDASHCSSCMRARWPQDDPAHVEALEEQIEADRIPEARQQPAQSAVARTDDLEPAHWFGPSCAKFVATATLAIWIGGEKERLSEAARAQLADAGNDLIIALEQMIEALI